MSCPGIRDVLDASAITGIIAPEDEAASLAGRLSQARRPQTSAVAIFEAATGLARIARHGDVRLLCNGNDFPRSDIVPA